MTAGVQHDERMAGYAAHSRLRQVPDALRVVAALGDRLARARSVVDLGCGTGALIDALAGAAPSATITGLDAAVPRITELRARHADDARLRFAVHDLREPFGALVPDGSADVVTMTAVLHWLHPAESTVVGRIAAVLTPGGAAVLTTYHPALETSGLGGTDAVIAEAAGATAARFDDAGIVPVSRRTLPADALERVLRGAFGTVEAAEHTARTAPADGAAFADYVDSTFGDYYQALFPDHAGQRAAVAAAAQRRLDATGAVTAMPVRTWLCTEPLPRTGARA